jgi:hypothetical protein
MAWLLDVRRRLGSFDRLLESPELARIVPDLEPRVLQRIVRRWGLERAGGIVALATSEQLLRMFDVDLWQSDEPGGEERFDADRFSLWLEVLHEAGPSIAARKIAEMDFDFVTAALSEQVLVRDEPVLRLDPVDDEPAGGADGAPLGGSGALLGDALERGDAHEVGGYQVLARHRGSWDALLSLLVELDASHPDFFRRLMRRLVRVSTELLDDEDLGFLSGLGATLAGDVAAGREERREVEGYVTPVTAEAFLASARGLRFETMPAPPPWDRVTTAWFRDAERRARECGEGARRRAGESGTPLSSVPARDVAGLLTILREVGARPEAVPRLGAGRGGSDRLARIRACVRYLEEHDGALHARRMEELGYVGNVLVAGASFSGHRFRAAEAAGAAAAVCNLGLENWPRAWLADGRSAPPADILGRHDLVTVFRVGWSVVHQGVGFPTARTLAEILSRLTSEDGGLHAHLARLRDGLRRQLEAGTPWRELDNLDVLLALDPPSWSVLVGLLDRCPVVPAAASSGFEFIAENRQIEWVHEFLRSLPDRLSDHGPRDPGPPGGRRRRRAAGRRGGGANPKRRV